MRNATLIDKGRILRLAKSIGDTSATPAIATITPAIGEAERPMLDAS